MTFIVVGRFGKAHGVKGAITVHSFTEPAANILQYHPWFIKTKKGWEEIKINSVEQRGKLLVAWIDQVVDRDEASAYTNQDISVLESVLPDLPDGEFYWQQLIGLTVTNLNQVNLGKVTEILATGANDVLIVLGEKKHLIPFVLDQYIKSINLETGEIVVDWDETF